MKGSTSSIVTGTLECALFLGEIPLSAALTKLLSYLLVSEIIVDIRYQKIVLALHWEEGIF